MDKYVLQWVRHLKYSKSSDRGRGGEKKSMDRYSPQLYSSCHGVVVKEWNGDGDGKRGMETWKGKLQCSYKGRWEREGRLVRLYALVEARSYSECYKWWWWSRHGRILSPFPSIRLHGPLLLHVPLSILLRLRRELRIVFFARLTRWILICWREGRDYMLFSWILVWQSEGI